MDGTSDRYRWTETVSAEGMWDWDLRAGTMFLSTRFRQTLGLASDISAPSGPSCPEEWFARVHPDDAPWLRAALDGLRAEPQASSGRAMLIEHRVRCGDGWRWLSCRGMLVRESGRPARLVGCVADVTERRAAEEALRLAEERQALLAAGANDGLWGWSPQNGDLICSPRWTAMLGLSEAEHDGTARVWFDRVLPADLPGLTAAIDLHLSGEREHLQHEFRMLHADGTERWLLVRGIAQRGGDGQAVWMAGSMTDITAAKRAEQQLLFDSFHDGMTRLPNRTLLLDRIGQALDRDRRGGATSFALLLIDLDRFKSINDALGSSLGDRLLTMIADRLIGLRRIGDTLARLSADEFAVLLDDIGDVTDAVEAAQELSQAIAKPLALDTHQLVVTASVGVALSATGYEQAEDMLRDATLAMHRAKSGGRARIEVFDGDLRRAALTLMRTEADLRTAVEQEQLCLFYQPIIALESGRIAGFEALMRWNHPERGLVPPGEFIPLAEECGLIVPMGRWALRTAARQLRVWQARFPRSEPFFMSVNVSARQFRDDDLVRLVEEVLADSGVPPSSLKLEITESMLMQDPDTCRRRMQTIRDMDVRLSIDDFGTGYSSLSYLHKFPADALKIDRSFVQALSSREGNAAIVQVVATLAQILGMDAVAEGVETEAEAEFLRDIRCRYAQGFLFARPAPAATIEALLVNAGGLVPVA
ncbi:GGDEF domain-containing phosphodiesterase [Azospirillum sp. SYSU D00513]|uniref:putative bifunctional diguanylate cyclase/phosphodiesterase n=1 Tax=Azospirillum sp. SYSU D00513 TaxID=2812561 RepID=UPI001FFF7C02|nr:GGDEF domain-containing phosphodiesterase [Azospirillum sp. SYSU D00513]